ncbi:TonB-dependent receptor [Erythrobacter sp. SDW2]|uniref:TonB-dependent receptor n=1 Tax=Erythrobacter sp. SDW2 TaxID=2907154 RepID=UPI001F46ACA7|nr:TonB-dependent receptor [Erythrobacter sp. SDW2]UIP06459.1 TonB-dependent receptor [Erythrobacter sp. SDW2]
MKATYRTCVSALALGVALPFSVAASAQDADADASVDATGLNVIVVTAAAGNQTQLESSISVTAIDDAIIQNFQPQSEAEIFRLLPGIQTPGTSGPGGNANIAVRGLPVATGGAPFVQLQEDGLPLVLFGDIQFGNNDYWTKFDTTTATVEAVRGGSATTLASQAPGAVINYISHTGEKEGGLVQLTKGVDFNDTKLDFRYGGGLGEDLYFHVGGYFQRGKDPLGVDYTINDSIQVKGNLTKEFGDGASFLRLFFKVADTQGINYTGAPALANFSGGKVTDIRAYPGFDGRSQTNYSIYNQNQLILNRQGVFERVGIDGISTDQKYIGAQLHWEFGDNITLDNRARYSDVSGSFSSPFLNIATRGSVIGSTVNGATVAQIRYADGPRAGQVFTGALLDNNVNVTTNIRDLGAFVNDLVLTGEFDVGSMVLTARGGFFYMDQTIAMDWHVNKSTRELSGDNPSQLDLFDAAGNQLTYQGISGYNNNWGSCCARDYDLGYTNTAPYAQLVLDGDLFNFDASVRFERVAASGYTIAGGNTFLVSPDPSRPNLRIEAITANGTREQLDYSRSYTSWSVGGLFKASSDVSVFARASRGGRFNADRQTVGGKIANDGSLCTGAQALAGANGCGADGVTPSVDFVNQYELGVKARGGLAGGDWTAELTLLKGDFSQSTFELSATRCPGGAGGCIIDSNYKSKGFEFFGTYRNGGLLFVANATYSDAQRKLSGAANYTQAPFIPDLSYSLSASYDFGDLATFGLSATGQTSVVDDALRSYEGKTTFNASLRVNPLDNLQVGLNVYNLFNTYDLRGNGATLVNGGVTPAIVSGTPVPGRNVSASIRLTF